MKTQLFVFINRLLLLPGLLLLCICDAQGQYVTKSGTNFVYQGQDITFYGSSFYPSGYNPNGTPAWYDSGFPGYISQMLSLETNACQNIMRPTDYWDATHTNYSDSTLWANMDYLMAACKSNGLFVLMDLSAWKLVLIQQKGYFTNASDWYAMIDFAAARYKTNKTIAFWSIVGEPAHPANQSQSDCLVNFYSLITTRLRNDDPNHLICAGAFTEMEYGTNYDWWDRIYALTNNDIAGYKTYSQNDLNLTPTIISIASARNKILLQEEFGMPQSQGDGTWSGQTENGLSTDVKDYYQNVYNAGRPNAQGFLFWNLSELVKSSSDDIAPDTMPATWGIVQQYSPPAQPPLNLGATAVSSSQINLSWTASPEVTVRSYNLYRSTTSGFTIGSGNKIASGVTGTSYSNTGLSGGTTYYYKITAVNQLNHESFASSQASATTQTAAPPPPTGLAAAAGNTQISLTWNSSSGATSYNVWRSTTSGGPYNKIATNVMTTAYTDTGLSNGTTYYYVVTAVNSGGESGQSNEASATPSSGTTLFYEAESLTVAATNCPWHIGTDGYMSGGAGLFLDSTATNQYITLQVTNIQAITYDVQIGVKNAGNRGIFQNAVASSLTGTYSNHGSPYDQYTSASTYTNADIGNVTFGASGTKYFRFTVTGKNAASSGYSLGLDYIRLIPQ